MNIDNFKLNSFDKKKHFMALGTKTGSVFTFKQNKPKKEIKMKETKPSNFF